VSVGIVVRLDELSRSAASSSDLHDRFLSHPAVAPFLRDGEPIEYGTHLIPEGGQAMVHDLTRPGLVVVGDAAGLTLNTGFTLRGMDFAAGSGIAAATTIDAMLRSGDASPQGLDGYPAELDRSFVGLDMKTFARAPGFLENPRIYNAYGQLFADVLHGVYDLDLTPRRKLVSAGVLAVRNSPIQLRQLGRDALSALRAL
jgi:electron transfer flavoprotein-quinone oxidoreductase